MPRSTTQVIELRRLLRIQSNAFDDYYEMYMGTKGTLIMTRELDAYLFHEGEGAQTKVETSRQSSAPVADSSASQPVGSAQRTVKHGRRYREQRYFFIKMRLPSSVRLFVQVVLYGVAAGKGHDLSGGNPHG
jgi:hypothetical protein